MNRSTVFKSVPRGTPAGERPRLVTLGAAPGHKTAADVTAAEPNLQVSFTDVDAKRRAGERQNGPLWSCGSSLPTDNKRSDNEYRSGPHDLVSS